MVLLKDYFKVQKKLPEKNPQTLINSDLKKHGNVDFSENQEKTKRQYLGFWASQMLRGFCYSYMHCWASGQCTQTEVGACSLMLVLTLQFRLWYWWLSSIDYCGGMTSLRKNYFTYQFTEQVKPGPIHFTNGGKNS